MQFLITPPPIKDNVKENIWCFINGFPRPCEDFDFDNACSIFTDGSAKDVNWPAIAVASSAAFQIDSTGIHRRVLAQVQEDNPASAAHAEFFALSLAIWACNKLEVKEREGPEIITDCSAVKAAFYNLTKHMGYRSKYGGLWREPGL